MLLSMLISFLLARKFRWKIYVALIAVIVTLISLFSVTVIYLYPLLVVWFWGKAYPLPLSFPFHVCILRYSGYGLFYGVDIYFLTLRIGYQGEFSLYNTLDAINFFGKVYIPFLLINVVGAIFGYWISKTSFIEKLLKKGQNCSP